MLASGFVYAGETAVEPSGNGVDLFQDSTDESDARSAATSAAAEELVEAVPAHEHEGSLADAVETAEGAATPLALLGDEVGPGTAQRLANGNTLITESNAGRAFEVTRDGKIVWDFYNPQRAGEGDRYIATIFELLRLPPDFPLDWIPTSAAD